MGYVQASLKIPDHTPEWIALTRVDSDGNVEPLGYVQRGELLSEVAMRDHIGRLVGVGPSYAIPDDWVPAGGWWPEPPDRDTDGGMDGPDGY